MPRANSSLRFWPPDNVLDARTGLLCEPDHLNHLIGRLRPGVEGRVNLRRLAHCQLMFEAAFLENDTDALAETSSAGLRVEPENRYGPRCGAPVAFEDFDQRCLASAGQRLRPRPRRS